LAAKNSVVSDAWMKDGFELPAPGLISAASTVSGPNAVLRHNSRPLTPLSAEKNSVLL
jgi:hypothetical protein